MNRHKQYWFNPQKLRPVNLLESSYHGKKNSQTALNLFGESQIGPDMRIVVYLFESEVWKTTTKVNLTLNMNEQLKQVISL